MELRYIEKSNLEMRGKMIIVNQTLYPKNNTRKRKIQLPLEQEKIRPPRHLA